MIKTFRLDNGVTFICEQKPDMGKVAMQIHIKTGSAMESDDENGLTNLMRAACLGGTETRTRDQIADDIETKGGNLDSGTGHFLTSFQAQALTRNAGETFGIMAELLLRPKLAPEEIEKEKMKICQELLGEQESPGTRAVLKFNEAVFSGQAGAHHSAGSAELVKSFTPGQVRKKHAEILGNPENIVISFAGDIDPGSAAAMVQKHFGHLVQTVTPKKPEMSFTGGDLREDTSHKQLSLHFGFRAPAKNDDDMYPVMLLRNLLSGGMSRPLFQEVREKRGLVYHVGAQYKYFDEAGVFAIDAETGKGNARELITVTMNLLGKIAREGFSEEDRQEALGRILHSRIAARESVDNLALYNAVQHLDFGKVTPPEALYERLSKVTNDDLRRVCAQLLEDSTYALAAVGPQKNMPTAEEITQLMEKQRIGLEIPQKSPVPSISPVFTQAATKETPAVAPKISRLPNGMIVITAERSGTISCGAWVGVGADCETREINGASHMNEHMMFKGTPSYGPGVIDRIVEGKLGGALNAYTSSDRTCYYFYNLDRSALPQIVDICGEMIYQARLDNSEFDGVPAYNKKNKPIIKNGKHFKSNSERNVVLEEIKRSNDNLRRTQYKIMMETAYPDQPHGWTVLGPYETIEKITVEQLAAYRDKFYTANNTVFCAVGPVAHEDFKALVESKYGHMPAKDFPPLPTPVYHGGTACFETHKAKLCSVRLAAEAVPTSHPDSTAYRILASIIGQGASSRLQKEIVNNKELSAEAGAGYDDLRNAGLFIMGGKTEAHKVKPMIAAMYGELRAVRDNVTVGELDKIKAGFEMDLISSFETNGSTCDLLACAAQDYGNLVTPADLMEKVRKVTVDDIRRLAGKVLESNPTAAFIVPRGLDKKYLPKHAEIVAFRDGNTPASDRNGPLPKNRKTI